MAQQGLDKNTKTAIIIIMPILLLLVGYFIYSTEFAEKTDGKLAVTTGTSDFFGEVEITDTSKHLKTKSEIYSRAEKTKQEKEIEKKNVVTDDDFFAMDFDDKERKNANTELQTGANIVTNALPGDGKVVVSTTVSKPSGFLPEKQSSNVEPPLKRTVTVPSNKTKGTAFSSSSGRHVVTPPDIFNKKPKEEPAQQPKEDNSMVRKGFYGTESVSAQNSSSKSVGETSEIIQAVVHNQQAIKTGETIRLRITEDCMISGVFVPANTYVAGQANFGSERVGVKVTSFKLDGKIIRTSLMVYELDGVAGIYIPGGINQQVAANAANQTVNQGGQKIGSQLNVPFLGSISLGAANAKLKDPVVTFPAGYKIMLQQDQR